MTCTCVCHESEENHEPSDCYCMREKNTTELKIDGAFFHHLNDDGFGVFLSYNKKEAERILEDLLNKAKQFDLIKDESLILNPDLIEQNKALTEQVKQLQEELEFNTIRDIDKIHNLESERDNLKERIEYIEGEPYGVRFVGLKYTILAVINKNHYEQLQSEITYLKEKIEKTIKECNDTIQAYEHLNESHQQKYEKTKDGSYLSTINRNNDLINENKKIKEILGDKNTVYDEEVKCPDCGLTPEKCYVHWDEVKDHCKNCNLYFIYNKKDPLNTIKHVTAEHYDSQEVQS